jgi:hypothetical protein
MYKKIKRSDVKILSLSSYEITIANEESIKHESKTEKIF